MTPARSLAALAVALLVAFLAGAAFVTPAGSRPPPGAELPLVRGAALDALPAAGSVAPGLWATSSAAALAALAVCGALRLLAGRKSPAAPWPAARSLVQLAAFESELGVQEPVGFWDPLGFTSNGDAAAFKRRRSVELKHGRISMLATMGYITPELTGKFPGYLSPSAGLKFADVPNGLAAISKVPALGWAQVVAYAGFCELSGGSEDWKTGTPGDYGFKVLTSADPAEKRKKLSAELANGRLAMMAIIGMFFQDGLTGSAWGDWALYTASPLRARDPKVAREFFGGGSSGPAYKVFDPTTELGVQDPVGFWDPLGLSADRNEAAFKRRRSVELKHGRVAMAAAIGYIVPEYFKFPGFLAPSLELKFADVPNGLAALSKVPGIGWVQIVFFAGIVEGTFGVGEYKTGNPGEYGWKVITAADPAAKAKKLSAELANGRLAMVAIIGMFFQDGLTGSAWGDWALYTASPLRAFENELGVQDPVGFWDPLGFTADGDLLSFKRRRSVELKHGRISMLATMGYITPEITGKFPGYLSPSVGLKFADIPNGLAAVTKIPALGWVQIFAYAGFCELTGPTTRAANREDYASITPGDYGFKVLTSSDPAVLRTKLSAEIANGRLAMMAIIGMFFQDGLTGSAWGDWALYTASPLRAEPVSVAAAAAVAAKAASAANAAAKAGAAVAGVAVAGGLAKGEGVAGEGADKPSFDPALQVGVTDPLGYFDPAGFCKKGDESGFRTLRVAEIKHGRVAMMAALGAVSQHYIKFPGFDGVPSGLSAVSVPPGTYGMLALFAVSGALELALWTESSSKEPGNFGDPLGLNQYTTDMRNRELNNGRMAMFAAIGIIAAEVLTGNDGVEQLGF